MSSYPDAQTVAQTLAPDEPVVLNRPHAAARAARFFVERFAGKSLYAVKANPSPELLRILWDNGIAHYDVASIAEVRLTRATLPRGHAVLHASGQDVARHSRGVFPARRAYLQLGYA